MTMVGENGPLLDGWCCTPHRDAPCMTRPQPVPDESHIVRGSE